MCRAMPFSARALKENIFFNIDIVVKKHKNVKVKIWFIVVCYPQWVRVITLIIIDIASIIFFLATVLHTELKQECKLHAVAYSI